MNTADKKDNIIIKEQYLEILLQKIAIMTDKQLEEVILILQEHNQ